MMPLRPIRIDWRLYNHMQCGPFVHIYSYVLVYVGVSLAIARRSIRSTLCKRRFEHGGGWPEIYKTTLCVDLVFSRKVEDFR